jgi:hypothetical protein
MTQLEQGFTTGGMGINSYCAKRKILGPNVCTGSIPLNKSDSNRVGTHALVRSGGRNVPLCFQAGWRFGIGISFASFRRFWAVAARRNSSRAPFGPLSLSRSSLRMRLRWANSISTFLRSRRAVRPSYELAIWRAMSRAPSWIDRGTYRAGSFGQHRGFKRHASRSYLLAR